MSSARRIYFSGFRVGADAFGRDVVAYPREDCGKPAAAIERKDGSIVYVHTLQVKPTVRVISACVPTPRQAADPDGAIAAPPAEVIAAQNSEPA